MITNRNPLSESERTAAREHISQALAIVAGKSLDGQSLEWAEGRLIQVEGLVAGTWWPLRYNQRRRRAQIASPGFAAVAS